MKKIKLINYSTTDSTNAQAKALAEQGAEELTVVTAKSQTNGKGQKDRSFYSNGGLYMSVILRPQDSVSIDDLSLLTLYAATCVLKALKRCFPTPLGIKWVNDILSKEGKVCGILTETTLSANAGYTEYSIVGIGINLGKIDFPHDLKEIAASLEVDENRLPRIRKKLVKLIAKGLSRYRRELKSRKFLYYYRLNCVIMDQKITVNPHSGEEPYEATVLGISDDGGLMTVSKHGAVILRSADVSVEY
ncbi:MAG: biotin--[Clostridia bacterium]|nr:biotin--[acetyl-CoA-carboxylase] ligase [Clostridia bacterium]